MLRLGVIDIGSNTSTLAVYRATPDGGLDRVAQVGEALRLMRRIGPDRRLPESAIVRTVEAMRGFVARAAELGVTRVEAVATSAVRDAVNQDELLARVREVVPVRVLDGETEGVCAAVSSVNLLPLADGFVIDQGGGSLQVAHITTRRARQVVSLPLGALRLTDAFLGEGVPTATSITALRRHLTDLMGSLGWFRADAGGTLVAVGGSVRALAKIDRRARAWPVRAGHGYRLTLDAVEGLWESLSRMSPEERRALPGLAAHRVDTITASAFTWFLLMRLGGFAEVRVSSYGIREGIAFRRLFGEDGEALVGDVRLAGLGVRFPGAGAAAARRARALAEERGEGRWAGALTIAAWVRAVGRKGAGELLEAPLAGFWQEEVLAAADLLGAGPAHQVPELVRVRLRALLDEAVAG